MYTCRAQIGVPGAALLTVAAFEAAYATRLHLAFERIFFLDRNTHILLIAVCVITWVALGAFQRVYDYLDSATTRHLLPGTFRQALIGTIVVILVQYLLRLDLSRSFLFLFFFYNLVLLPDMNRCGSSIERLYVRLINL